MKTEFINKVETVNTGGGCLVDIITLWDGRVIGLNDECAVLYDSIEAFWDGGSNNLPAFTIPRKETP
jgi:hypothetical protein